MDTCTLVVVTMTTLQGCFSPPECHVSSDGNRQFCIPATPRSCEQASPYYLCERPDKTTYTLPWTAESGDALLTK